MLSFTQMLTVVAQELGFILQLFFLLFILPICYEQCNKCAT